MFRSLLGATVLYPSDAVSTEHAVELAAIIIRVARPTTDCIYDNEEVFEVINVAR
jgi:transketolase